MWFKKLFTQNQHNTQKPKPQSQSQSQQAMEQAIKKFQQQDDVMVSTIAIDIEPDTRYKKFKQISRSSQIKFPLILLHETQNILMHQLGIFQGRILERDQWQSINLLATDRQLLITPNLLQPNIRNPNPFFSIQYGHIQKSQIQISKKKQPTRLKLLLHNQKQLHIKSVLGDLVVKLQQILNNFAFVKGVNKFYAYRYRQYNQQKQLEYRGWKVYDIRKQFQRQGLVLEEDGGLGLKYVDNAKGNICQTYPELLVVPSKISNAELNKCSHFRTKERFPALTYVLEFRNNRYSVLFRCSQNKVGALNARSKQDQLMMKLIGQCTMPQNKQTSPQSPKSCKIYDARGYYAALGNMFAGKGYQKPQFYTNCEISWLNIPNIHAVRDSYNTLINYHYENDSNFYTLCAQTGWYDYLYLIIDGAKSIVRDLLNGVNCIVHCSDGWDRTSQLCALSQIILDPYFRTIQGFAVLVEKDWRHFGHKFRSRTGQYHPNQYHPYQRSPIFIQFLDSIFQILQQFPLSFQYNQSLLLFLAKQVSSNNYGTFMSNNIQESKQLQIESKTVSIWSQIFMNRQIYRNPFYQPQLGEFWLDVGTEPKFMVVWRNHFIGEGKSGQSWECIMKHQVDMNKILKNRYYQAQREIDELNSKIKMLDQANKDNKDKHKHNDKDMSKKETDKDMGIDPSKDEEDVNKDKHKDTEKDVNKDVNGEGK